MDPRLAAMVWATIKLPASFSTVPGPCCFLSALCAVIVMFSLLRAVRGQGLAAASVDEIDAAAGHQKDCVVDMAAELSLGEQVQSNACGPCCWQYV